MAEELIKVPDIGGAEGADVVEVLVAVGDVIQLEQSLIVVESDKASMEIPASSGGTITELRVAVGDAVSEGDVILVLATEGAVTATVQIPAEAVGERREAEVIYTRNAVPVISSLSKSPRVFFPIKESDLIND